MNKEQLRLEAQKISDENLTTTQRLAFSTMHISMNYFIEAGQLDVAVKLFEDFKKKRGR